MYRVYINYVYELLTAVGPLVLVHRAIFILIPSRISRSKGTHDTTILQVHTKEATDPSLTTEQARR